MMNDPFADLFAALSATLGRIVAHGLATMREAFDRAWPPVPPPAPSHDDTATDPYRSPGEPAAVPRDDGFDEWFDFASKNDHVDAVPWALEQRDAAGNVILRADIVRREPVSRPRPPIAPPKPVSE